MKSIDAKKESYLSGLLDEFVDLYKNPAKNIPADADAVIILAGDRPPRRGENVSRIKYTTTLLEKLGKDIPIIFSGITEDKETALNLMITLGIPEKNCYFQDCGKLGAANTKTQFEKLIKDPLTKKFKNLIIVTDIWHIPRVKRTAGKFLPPKTKFTVSGDSEECPACNNFLMIMEEIEKIMKYSTKGDILERPR